ncbi:hypothetical protein SAMN04488542_103253 [Fontibacillus panacisegetis]|uniref:Uncharacterized protein n=1 Tax=Fontibacillus panacisegetis TaxID=670482 RepID=A0A1G7GYG3_9BACL|nr:hypothetical protein SAMN04488542_103253 [Fontibacillus panacisegetis]
MVPMRPNLNKGSKGLVRFVNVLKQSEQKRVIATVAAK